MAKDLAREKQLQAKLAKIDQPMRRTSSQSTLNLHNESVGND